MASPAQRPLVLAEVERFRQLVARHFGLAFEDAKLDFLGEVLRRRLETDADVETYLAQLERAPSTEELGLLAQELTVPETYFFRNIAQFQALAALVLPDRINARGSRLGLRLLSAGCASGEEAYSLAMTAKEHLAEPSSALSVRGVDISPAALHRAAGGTFTSWALRETPAEALRKWFREDGRAFVLDERIRSAVRFERRNLAVDDSELWQPESYDVVFCRNVIMYFTPDSAAALIARITRSLAPGGYLFLGHAETLRGLSQDFHLRHTHGTFYYQRKDALESAAAPAGDSRPTGTKGPLLATFVEASSSWIDAIQRASDRIQTLARESGPRPAAPRPRVEPDLGNVLDLLGRERFSEALHVVRDLPPASARAPGVLLLEAVLLTHSGELERATEVCHKLLALDELSAGAHYVLALCREATAERGAAADHDHVAVYLDPTFAMPRLHLGLLARRAGDLHAARRELGQALLLLQREDPSRLLLFGGGFGREALAALCAAEIRACGGRA